MIAGSNKTQELLSEEEVRIRQEENELFGRIAAPPKANGVASLLVDEDESESEQSMSKKTDETRRRKQLSSAEITEV
jgi:hypothetical protein